MEPLEHLIPAFKNLSFLSRLSVWNMKLLYTYLQMGSISKRGNSSLFVEFLPVNLGISHKKLEYQGPGPGEPGLL